MVGKLILTQEREQVASNVVSALENELGDGLSEQGRGFHAAPRKAFVADGSETNWGVWRNHFSHYTPIVDFVHALM
jgi:hypothetical protein